LAQSELGHPVPQGSRIALLLDVYPLATLRQETPSGGRKALIFLGEEDDPWRINCCPSASASIWGVPHSELKGGESSNDPVQNQLSAD
jgi:hypothetical protein